MTLLPLPRAIAAQTRCAAAIAAALMTLSGAAYAQQAATPAETPNTLETIQVSGDWLGTGLQNSVKTYPGARTVVKKEEIQSTGAVTIGDVMRRIPGVQVTDNSGTAGGAMSLNIGAIAGLPIAFAAYFWANRLLPVAMPQRPDAEISWFFIAWAIAAVLAQIRPDRRMWQWQLWTGALLFMGIPVLNVFTTSSHLGVTLFMAQGPWSVAGFDLTVLGLGMGLAFAARHLGRKKKADRKAGKQSPQETSETRLQEAA
ncbi:TonB-dependent receptor plug domain-containing protein [Herbaspirillum hiltneri]|uniref:TonB-dependent receptor plug domain-containing protein n=1 Tax=Herbaspirillum hiltneri TaxID=341045 RepID=UPI00069E9CF5|nr:TonB-dependent receptor plug domain-containing protein [Herbaspirillum hiltneri]